MSLAQMENIVVDMLGIKPRAFTVEGLLCPLLNVNPRGFSSLLYVC